MTARATPGGMDRRSFLLGALGGIAALSLAGCTPTPPAPSPTPTPTPTPTPVPTSTSRVPAPAAFVRSNWTADQFARGALSFDGVGTTDAIRESLTEPIDDRLFFAGEATSVDAPGTLHGAFDSGRRVALQIDEIAVLGERIAVVGAGIAGLTAARLLRERGHEVFVVEARNRLGGRIESVEDDDAIIELGPSFVDANAEDLLAELGDAGVATRDFDWLVESRTSDGQALPIDPVGAAAIATAGDWARARSFDTSLSVALDRSGARELSTEPDETGVSPAAWLTYALRSSVEPMTGAAPNRLSATRYVAPPTPAVRLVTGRLADYIDALAADLEVVLASPVRQITRTDDRASLRFESGESLAVDRVIVTAPLGVLKSDTITFEPQLPPRQRRAISVLGAGAVDVAWLRFDEAFWRGDASEPPTVLTQVGGTSAVAAWVDIGRPTNDPILLAVFADGSAERLAGLDDDAFLAEILPGLEGYAPTDSS
ncbi:flavin monoamine oxidase family protein [Agromyces atrinae]|uniref:FAD-dependent oxidoreductase n=1 Tax=Agromyces atrinae TaxID=592376 RepID=A0A4Q2MA35_9MICO|nr:NAD(P)/FAD-dependent oxidoreductase [Agromyces atrinae]NYD67237.1 monoamine oxidase [Agromyces atrinae]RXZ86931.1 FAD-dependent oxidoreductase [Agromyces atrinae]